MRIGWAPCVSRVIRHNVKAPRRLLSALVRPEQPQLSKTRNIGIIAHIDAGKTTTTERMLYYSGYTRRIGDVDEGSTVTDFLPAERARGITIQSAAITFHWPPLNEQAPSALEQELPEMFDLVPRSTISHNINLIDTPGHADFTFEVLRSLRVLDGAVCILDGVAGVEAQTEKVWMQAGHYQIPRIVFVNKLDRVGAAFSRTVKEIGVRLHGWPAVCQIPWWRGGNGEFIGVGDVVYLRGMLWQGATDGSHIHAFSLQEMESHDKNFASEIKNARRALVELLSEHDDGMVELFLEYGEDHLAIPGTHIIESLRKTVLQAPQKIIPVFAGASFRNIGVQPLLDGIVDLLPSPVERPDPEISLGGRSCKLSQLLEGNAHDLIPLPTSRNQKPLDARNLVACALAFKVVNDVKRGILVYVRVYSGSIDKGSTLFNTNLGSAERVPKLLKMYASDAVEVDSIPGGQIGVIPGLKQARTGDTLIVYKGLNVKSQLPSPVNTLQLRPIQVPPPVFFTSIEPHSLSEQKHVLDTLSILLREDPSLQLSVDEESGQTHLAGMGDLHLEIARDRLLNDFKAKARIGKIEIGYRETINSASSPYTSHLERIIAGKVAKASITVSVTPINQSAQPDFTRDEDPYTTAYETEDGNCITIAHPELSKIDSQHPLIPPHLNFSQILAAIHTGACAALARGPVNGFPIAFTAVTIQLDAKKHISTETNSSAISTVTRQAVSSSLRASCEVSPSTLMEPVMLVNIFVPESSMGSVVQDVSSARGGQVLSLDGPDSTPSTIEDLHINPSKIYTPPDPFSSGFLETSLSDSQRQIVARVPLKEMVGYLSHLRSLTGGRGTFVMQVDGFEKMSELRQRGVLEGLRECI
ncbi:mitochondrial translation elongation factor-like protein G [Lindgomyces ingoldianus]|uniref:Mitochondrial translation elongation factor-like protein G n=1 Tax=Lindgomyces ingoldianus TaxID=673940 RepID=A0ACB6RE97_9PLEO|nr:mitochondrial translation elongation factor-like protein G [Lindgomyces ingoldianus]KAF2477598.1 mitochondrial translation elongation factor-like protein G [Lindgomyces ingoldianus]